MTATVFKIVGIVMASILGLGILLVLGYVIYVSCQYYRIKDNLALTINNNQEEVLQTGISYKATTFNIGFGAYNHDFSFFMDTGQMKTGENVQGDYSKARSKEIVLDNTNGAIEQSKALNADFYLFQEVDIDGDRSHHVNQLEMLTKAYSNFGYTFAENFHSAYLLYPFNDPHGKTTAGIATFSKYKMTSATRISYPVDESFPNKYFDLDRCFSINRFQVGENKQLVMINSHMSAFDEGGLVRQQQLIKLNQILTEEYSKGNYVIVGGDFNHDIANTSEMYETTQNIPDWVYKLDKEDLPEHFDFAAASDDPSCRSTDIPYVKGVNYSVTLDGFIVSDNVEVESVTNLINGVSADFKHSDHNPATLTFKLK